MTTTYFKMPIDDEAGYTLTGFKARYFQLTVETVQDSPLENDVSTHYLFGSVRIQQADIDTLASEYPMVTTTVDVFPVGWVTLEMPLP